MKKGYTIEHEINECSRVFVCTNYNHWNEVFCYGFTNEEIAIQEKDKHDIGIWRIKKIKS